MKQSKPQTYVLLNTRFEFEYSDYVEYCNLNNIEPAPEGSNEYWDWYADEKYWLVEDDMTQLKNSKLKDRTFVIEGTLGLWNGRTIIKPIVANGIAEAIKHCNGRSIDDLDVTLDTKYGVIYVNAYHHDGVNSFVLRMLNKNGEKWINSAIERWEEDEGNNEFCTNSHYYTKIKSISDIW